MRIWGKDRIFGSKYQRDNYINLMKNYVKGVY